MTAPTFRSLLSENLPPVMWMGFGAGLGATPQSDGFIKAMFFAMFCAAWFGLLMAAFTVVEWGIGRACAEWVPR